MNVIAIVIDIILILIFAAGLIDGFRKGFVRMLLAFISIVLCLMAARQFSAPVAEWADKQFIHEPLSEYISETVEGSFDGVTRENISQVIEKIGFSADTLFEIAESAGASVDELVEDLTESDEYDRAVDKIALAIETHLLMPLLELLAFAVIYLLLHAVCNILISLVCRVFKLPVIKSVDKSLGLVLGGIKGLAALAALSVVLVLATAFAPDSSLAAAVDETVLANAMYKIAFSIIS